MILRAFFEGGEVKNFPFPEETPLQEIYTFFEENVLAQGKIISADVISSPVDEEVADFWEDCFVLSKDSYSPGLEDPGEGRVYMCFSRWGEYDGQIGWLV